MVLVSGVVGADAGDVIPVAGLIPDCEGGVVDCEGGVVDCEVGVVDCEGGVVDCEVGVVDCDGVDESCAEASPMQIVAVRAMKTMRFKDLGEAFM
jgi:hypothetical protein